MTVHILCHLLLLICRTILHNMNFLLMCLKRWLTVLLKGCLPLISCLFDLYQIWALVVWQQLFRPFISHGENGSSCRDKWK